MMKCHVSLADHLPCKNGGYENSPEGKVANYNGESVAILLPRGSLASALASGLAALGWIVRDDPAGDSGVPVVLVTDDHGHLHLPAVSGSPSVPRHMILVGGLTCLGELADGLLLGADAAVNADLPFPEVLTRVDAALRAGPLPPGDRDRLRGRLREREAESERFGRLTDREAAVLADLAAGVAATDIARRRPVALATVRTQIAGILHKLEVSSQTAAVALTYQACRDSRVLVALRRNQHY
jgi:DNA-binding CsgD family transcriptional regulator